MAAVFSDSRTLLRRDRVRRWAFGLAGLTALAAAASGRAPAAGEQWFLLKIGGTPVGYVREASTVRGTGAAAVLVSDSTMKMTINRLGSKVSIEVLTRSEETADGRLRKIGYEMRASVLATKSEAVVKDGAVEVRSEAGGKSYIALDPLRRGSPRPRGRAAAFAGQDRQARRQDRIPDLLLRVRDREQGDPDRSGLGKIISSAAGRFASSKSRRLWPRTTSRRRRGWTKSTKTLRQESPTPFGSRGDRPVEPRGSPAAEGGGSLPEELYTRSIIRTTVRLPGPGPSSV